MPLATISSNSILQTSNGWVYAHCVGSGCEIFGIDRGGKVALLPVEISGSGKSRPVFLGTEAAFGIFASTTSLRSYSGKSEEAAQLVLSSGAEKPSFERSNNFTDFAIQEESCNAIWEEIVSDACVVNGDKALLHCHGEKKGNAYIHVFTVHGEIYSVVDRNGFFEALKKDWARVLLGLSSIVHSSISGEDYLIKRENSLLTAWLLSAHIKLKKGYQLSYRQQQYTDRCTIKSAKSLPKTVSRGQCVCFGLSEDLAYAMSWKDAGWRPLIAGFLVNPNSAH